VCAKFAAFVDVDGAATIPEEVKSPNPESSANDEETQPRDPDTVRGEAFKRMFPDIPRMASEQTPLRGLHFSYSVGDGSLPLCGACCHLPCHAEQQPCQYITFLHN
jgi:hypothetical protein